MYVSFSLKHFKNFAEPLVRAAICDWALKYQTQYMVKVVDNELRLTFNQPKTYSLFAMTWQSYPFEVIDCPDF